MNDPDWLKEASAALREEHTGAPDPAVDTRARMLATVSQQERQRRRWTTVLVPLAAVFLFSSAWAASSGHLRGLFQLLPTPSLSTTTTVQGAQTRGSSITPQALTPPVQDPEQEKSAAGEKPAAEEKPAAASASALGGNGAAVVASASGGNSEEDRLYREAHRAHFVERNPARALAAWDAYLRAQKSGRFATEATYNRALTLLRLGRTAEARRALEPFAQGRFGSYRQQEARKLLDAL